MPNGHLIERYHFLSFGRGSVAVIVENGEGQVLMERVARYPTQSVTWELPAGGVEGDESILEAAVREVEEETGCTTLEHQHIYTYNPINGISDLCVYVVHCKAGQHKGQIDENEIQGMRWFSRRELKDAIYRKETTDGLALTGLLLHINQP